MDLLYVLIIVAPLVFGLGVSLLSSRLFSLAINRLPASEAINSVFRILMWLVGNGGIVFGGAHFVNVSGSLSHVQGCLGIIFLGYLLGFGCGLTITALVKPDSFANRLRRFLTERQIEALVIMLRYTDMTVEDGARSLGMTTDEFIGEYESALREINKRWKCLKDFVKAIKHEES